MSNEWHRFWNSELVPKKNLLLLGKVPKIGGPAVYEERVGYFRDGKWIDVSTHYAFHPTTFEVVFWRELPPLPDFSKEPDESTELDAETYELLMIILKVVEKFKRDRQGRAS